MSTSTTHIYSTGVCLPVEDFFREKEAQRWGYKEAKQEAFDRCSGADWHVRRLVRDTLRFHFDKAHRKVRIAEIDFHEFDSGNLSHAGGHFTVDLHGPKDMLEKWARDEDCAGDDEVGFEVTPLDLNKAGK